MFHHYVPSLCSITMFHEYNIPSLCSITMFHHYVPSRCSMNIISHHYVPSLCSITMFHEYNIPSLCSITMFHEYNIPSLCSITILFLHILTMISYFNLLHFRTSCEVRRSVQGHGEWLGNLDVFGAQRVGGNCGSVWPGERWGFVSEVPGHLGF